MASNEALESFEGKLVRTIYTGMLSEGEPFIDPEIEPKFSVTDYIAEGTYTQDVMQVFNSKLVIALTDVIKFDVKVINAKGENT